MTMPFVCPTFYYKIPLGPIEEEDDVDDGQMSMNTSPTAEVMLQHWEHNPPAVQNLFVHFAPPIPNRRNKTAPPLFVPKTIDEEAETTASEAEVADTDKGVAVSNVERVDPSFILRDGGEAQVIEDISQEFEEIDESENEENASFAVSPTPPPSDAPPLAAGLHQTFDFGVLRVQWKVDATKFNKNDTLIVSPVFDVWLDNKRVPFRVQLMPSSSNFKKSDGLGHIHLSCKAEAEEAPEGNIRFSFSIGSQQARDPAENDFSKNNVGKLADTTAWDFRSAAEKGFVLVSLEVMLSEAVCA